MFLLDEKDGIKFLGEKIRDREHWIIPVATQMAIAQARIIEERFYQGDANADFNFILIPRPAPGILIATVVYAHKRRMSFLDLMSLGGDRKDFSGREPTEISDILISPDTPQVFFEWFYRTFNEFSIPVG